MIDCPCTLISEADFYKIMGYDFAQNTDFKRELSPAFVNAHSRFIKPLIGKACFDELCAAIKANTLTPDQIELLQEGCMFFAYAIAFEHASSHPSVEFNVSGAVILDPTKYQHALPGELLGKISYYQGLMETYKTEFENWLQDNVDKFPCYEPEDCAETNTRYGAGQIRSSVRNERTRKISPYLGVLALMLLFAACKPKTEYIRETHTIVRDTTVIVPSVVRDTLLQFNELHHHDTVRMVQDRVHVEMVRLPGEKMYIRTKCKGDSIKVRTLEQKINNLTKITKGKQERGYWGKLFHGAGVVLFVLAGLAVAWFIARRVLGFTFKI